MEEEKVVIEKDGKRIECDMLFGFNCDENSRVYIGYTDHSKNADGKENIYVSSYDPLLGKDTMEHISTPEEFEMVNEVLEKIKSGSYSDEL